jgi:DNA-binding transcriptional MerR regulator
MSKSADAFRTISEVAEWLDTPAHVLRFWESKFTQVKPVKRAGGRRYYRPADMRLLGGIKKLLHDDGMTIKGVQNVLREQGIKHVSSLCALSLGDDEEDDLMLLEDVPASEPVDTVVPFAKPESSQEPEATADAALAEDEQVTAAADGAVETADSDDAQQHGHEEPEAVSATPAEAESADAADETPPPPPPAEEPALPSFLQRSMEERRAEPVEATQAPEPVAPAPPPIAEPMPSALTHLSRIERLSPEQAQQIAPILERLKAVAR